jgi:hypothetical protein
MGGGIYKPVKFQLQAEKYPPNTQADSNKPSWLGTGARTDGAQPDLANMGVVAGPPSTSRMTSIFRSRETITVRIFSDYFYLD